jgi:hypothetical protein
MNIGNLVPVSSLVMRYGVKVVLYGGPGTGKTPLLTSAPNPVICFTEPGFLSVRKYNGPAFPAFIYKDIREFWMWAIQSQEAKQFSTFCCDSISQMAEIILAEELVKHKDPRKAYGEMSQKMMEIMNWIYFTPSFNALLIAKEGQLDVSGTIKYRPYFPGQDLHVKVPHLFDSVWRVEKISTSQGMQRVIRTQESFNAFARDRSGNLQELEAPDINALITKCLL